MTGKALEPSKALAMARTNPCPTQLAGLHLSELRAALWALYWDVGHGVAADSIDAALADVLLDAIYSDVSGGSKRPVEDPGAYEPELGTSGANHGVGQRRFWFVPRDPFGRVDLYDRIAGLLLREANEQIVVSALYLYPPSYSVEADDPIASVFMLLLEARRESGTTSRLLDIEYDRLARLVLTRFADVTRDHGPAP